MTLSETTVLLNRLEGLVQNILEKSMTLYLPISSLKSYFRHLISSYSMQPKKLWSALDSLLCRKSASCLPACDSPSLPAFSFLNYFGDKIAKLSSSLLLLPPAHHLTFLLKLLLLPCLLSLLQLLMKFAMLYSLLPMQLVL